MPAKKPALTQRSRETLCELRGRLRAIADWLGTEIFPFAMMVTGDDWRNSTQECVSFGAQDNQCDSVDADDASKAKASSALRHIPGLPENPDHIHFVLARIPLDSETGIVFGWDVDFSPVSGIVNGMSYHETLQSLKMAERSLRVFPTLNECPPRFPNTQVPNRYLIELVCTALYRAHRSSSIDPTVRILATLDPKHALSDYRELPGLPEFELTDLITLGKQTEQDIRYWKKKYKNAGVSWPSIVLMYLNAGFPGAILNLIEEVLEARETLVPATKTTSFKSAYEKNKVRYACHLINYVHNTLQPSDKPVKPKRQLEFVAAWMEIDETYLRSHMLFPRPDRPAANNHAPIAEAFKVLFGELAEEKGNKPAQIYEIFCKEGNIGPFLTTRLVCLDEEHALSNHQFQLHEDSNAFIASTAVYRDRD